MAEPNRFPAMSQERFKELKKAIKEEKVTIKEKKKDVPKEIDYGIIKRIDKFLKKKLSYKKVFKEGKERTIVIPKNEPYYKSLYFKNQWENEKNSFLMK
jgi:hypothetical protein